MAGKDEGFSLTQRQQNRYDRFEKQQEVALQKHLAIVKQIEKEWDIFKEQNSKAFKLYNKSQEARSKDSKYQFDISEAANWKVISDKIQQKGERIAEESEQYKRKHKIIEEEKRQFYAECVKEWENKKSGKELYDTSSSDEDNLKLVENNQFVHLTKKESTGIESEIAYITEQIIALGDLHSEYTKGRAEFPKDSYDYAILSRERQKVDQFRRIYEHKLRERERILQGERPTFELQSEVEDSDGGYSDIEGFVEEKKYITDKIRKRRKRQLKPKPEDFLPEEKERREKEREEAHRLQQQQLEQQAVQVVDFSSSSESEEEEEDNMANNLRWSVQNVTKFHGEAGQSATQHLYEFDDFLRAARIQAPEPAERQDRLDVNVEHIINDFVTTLKGKARIWYDMNVPVGERTTVRDWNSIRDKFKAYFHPLGSTKEQRIKAWKDMRWDPIKEAIDDFAYKYKELGQSLGLDNQGIFDNFKACIPGHYFVFVYNANDMAQAVDNLKKCIAAGPMGVTSQPVNPTSGTTQTTTNKDDKLKFMAVTEETHQEMFNQLQDTIDERLGPVEEGMYETKDMIDQVYQMISQQNQQGQQNQGQMRFNQGQGQMQNRFGQNQNRFNRGRGQGQSQKFWTKEKWTKWSKQEWRKQ